MQRLSMSSADGEESALSGPSYQPSLYDSSLPPLRGGGAYYPYPGQEPSPTWAPYASQEGYATTTASTLASTIPPPPSWYTPAAGEEPAPSFTSDNGQSSSTHPGMDSAYTRPSYDAPAEYPPAASMLASGSKSGSGPSPDDEAGKEKTAVSRKKKRRKTSEREEALITASTGVADGDKDKRTKTGRACDACRGKKIRCDILNQENEMSADSAPLCAHCKQHRLECTFFLPITETRFKRKRAAPEDKTPRLSAVPNSMAESPDANAPPKEVPGRIEGPTSLSFLLHTSIPASATEAYDLRYHHSWEVSEDGNGLIRVRAPPSRDGGTDDPTQTHNRLNKPIINANTISRLVNAYFDHLTHLFPVISRSEFAAKATPTPLLLYSICGIAATRREFPREMFAGIRGVINGLLRSNDILSDARIENVQALLVLAQVGDLHAQPTAATASASLMRTGSAIRMAQDLGLHRESHLRAQTPQDLAYVELRRRIWATCVIMDRWYGAALGIPLQVDLLDCDVLLPAGYEINVDQPPSTWPIEPSFVALTEHLKLSILVGRVLKTIYSPTGLKHATDEQLYSILEDMRAWKEELPEGLRFVGSESSFASGLLHLAYTTLHFLLWRPFMRITYICPPHLQFALETMHWSEMAMWATEALDWLNHNPQALDTLFIYAYTATSCALVQYHTWVRRQEPGSLESLKQVRETAMEWEVAVQPDQMSIRRKTCETMTLLYEAALKTNPEEERPPAINPTAGVHTRPALGKAIWLADPSKPYGGIWVAQDNAEKADSGLTENSVVLQGKLSQERPPPEFESTDPTIRARTMSRLRAVDPAYGGGGGGVGQQVNGDGNDGSDSGSVRSYSGDNNGMVNGYGGGMEIKQDPVQDMLGRGLPGQQLNGIDLLNQSIHIDQQHQAALQQQQQQQHHPQTHLQQQQLQQQQQQQQQQQHDPMQIFREMQMTGSNVNPQMNFGSLEFTSNPSGQVNGYEVESAGMSGYDPTILDGLPVNGFNFDQWNTWFSNIDRMGPQPIEVGTGPIQGYPMQPPMEVQPQQQGMGPWT